MAKEFYQLIRSFGGISLEYTALSESDFSAASGAAYVPPERGDYRRIAGSREIQLLSDAPGVIESFQTSASGELFLPANTVADNTNDAGDGRLFFLKNSGTQDLIVNDYLGNPLKVLRDGQFVIIIGNDSNNWDIYSWSAVTQANGVEVLTETAVFNFDSPLSVTDDGNGKVTVGLPAAGLQNSYIMSFSYDRKAISGRVLDLNYGNVSSLLPYIVPATSTILGFSWSSKGTTTSSNTIAINNNGSLVASTTVAGIGITKENIILGSPVALSALDELSAEITLGGFDNINLYVHIRTS